MLATLFKQFSKQLQLQFIKLTAHRSALVSTQQAHLVTAQQIPQQQQIPLCSWPLPTSPMLASSWIPQLL
jgi:hypothetical protein